MDDDELDLSTYQKDPVDEASFQPDMGHSPGLTRLDERSPGERLGEDLKPIVSGAVGAIGTLADILPVSGSREGGFAETVARGGGYLPEYVSEAVREHPTSSFIGSLFGGAGLGIGGAKMVGRQVPNPAIAERIMSASVDTAAPRAVPMTRAQAAAADAAETRARQVALRESLASEPEWHTTPWSDPDMSKMIHMIDQGYGPDDLRRAFPNVLPDTAHNPVSPSSNSATVPRRPGARQPSSSGSTYVEDRLAGPLDEWERQHMGPIPPPPPVQPPELVVSRNRLEPELPSTVRVPGNPYPEMLRSAASGVQNTVSRFGRAIGGMFGLASGLPHSLGGQGLAAAADSGMITGAAGVLGHLLPPAVGAGVAGAREFSREREPALQFRGFGPVEIETPGMKLENFLAAPPPGTETQVDEVAAAFAESPQAGAIAHQKAQEHQPYRVAYNTKRRP